MESSGASAAPAGMSDLVARMVAALEAEDRVLSMDEPGVSDDALRVIDLLAPLESYDDRVLALAMVRLGLHGMEPEKELARRTVDVGGGRRCVEPAFATKRLLEAAPSEREGFLDDVIALLRGDGEGTTLERLRLQAARDPGGALDELRTRFDAVTAAFDLVGAERLVRAVETRPSLGRPQGSDELDVEVLAFRRALENRVRFSGAFYRTGRYLQRSDLHDVLRAFATEGRPRALHLHAAGGTGKTILIQWLTARMLVPERAVVATYDFDRQTCETLDVNEVARQLALQLEPQLAGPSGAGPFQSALGAGSRSRRAAAEPAKHREHRPRGPGDDWTSRRSEMNVPQLRNRPEWCVEPST